MRPDTPYRRLDFPDPPEDRPYTIIDMVTTIDGKIVSGERGEDVGDLGSAVDHAVMRHLEDLVDGVLIGAGTLRATPTGWDPKRRFRVVVSNSGKVDTAHSFFKGPDPFVAVPRSAKFEATCGVSPLLSGAESVDLIKVLRQLRAKGCNRLLILGGSRLNGSFLHADLIDELFLTIAPRIKLGEGLPTIAEGAPFPREALLGFRLLEHHAVGSEIFLRYRRDPKR